MNKEEKLRQAELEILSVLAESDELPWAIQMVLLKILETTVFSCGAIRLSGGENYSFLAQENITVDCCCANRANGSGGGPASPEQWKPKSRRCYIEWAAQRDSKSISRTGYGSILIGRAAEIQAGRPEDPRRTFCRECLSAGFQTIILVPLKAGREVVGNLNLHDYRPEQLEQQILFFLESVAQSIAYVIKHLQYRQELELSNEKIRSLSLKLLRAYEEERSRLARELHDEIGQALTAVKLNLQIMGEEIEKEAPALKGMLKSNIDLLNDTVLNVRRQIVALRPPSFDEGGLVEVLEDMAAEFTRRTGIKTSFQAGHISGRLPQELETALYRCVQESLTNVARHSGAGEVLITLHQQGEEIFAAVKDNGKGFDPHALKRTGKRIGLRGMEERVTLLGGHFEIYSSPGEGTEIRVAIPLLRSNERQ